MRELSDIRLYTQAKESGLHQYIPGGSTKQLSKAFTYPALWVSLNRLQVHIK